MAQNKEESYERPQSRSCLSSGGRRGQIRATQGERHVSSTKREL